MVPKLLTYLTLTAAIVSTSFSVNIPQANCTAIPAKWQESVEQTWDFSLKRGHAQTPNTTLDDYQNWALDQIMDGNGTINVCMRWGGNKTLTETTRHQIEAVYRKQYEQWFEWLPGWDNYPFEKLNFNVIGWAVSDHSLIEGSVDSFEVYTDLRDENGYPTCDPGCSRDLHQDGDFSACYGGIDQRYHQFLFLDPSWGEHDMGASSGLGVFISLFGWETVGSQLGDWPVLVHELGHTFGFPDYITDGFSNHTICDILWLPPDAPQQFVMKPGDGGASVPKVTEFEGWMLRYWWSRFSRMRGWQHDSTAFPSASSCEWIQET